MKGKTMNKIIIIIFILSISIQADFGFDMESNLQDDMKQTIFDMNSLNGDKSRKDYFIEVKENNPINHKKNSDFFVIGEDNRIFTKMPTIRQDEIFRPSQSQDGIFRAIQSVVKLNIEGKKIECTGFFISNNLIITNYHCIKTQKECEDTNATLNYYKNSKEIKETKCLKYIGGDESLDYSLLTLDKEKNKINNLFNQNNITVGEKLFIIGHPYGSRQISSPECTILEINQTKFTHDCDTQPGNSGSPIYLAKDFSLIGLHNEGIDQTDDSNKTNSAIFIKEILEDIKQNFGDTLKIITN